jgi:ketosteroid isomerase-like protein
VQVFKVIRTGDLALTHNDWKGTAVGGSDGTRVQIGGRAIEVVHRRAGGTWRYVLDDPNARELATVARC